MSTEASGEAAPVFSNKRNDSEIWSSRPAFYFAAVGAAVGFGNVWRFPSLSYDYGGGAFFIPYLMALFLIGIPILVLEIGFGQYWQVGDAGVFGHFNRRMTGVGVSSIICGFIVVTYYSMLIAWVVNAFFDSFGSDAPWDKENVTSGMAIEYFFNEIIGMDTVNEDLTPTRMMGKNVGYSFLVWLVVFFCLAFGTKWTGRLTYFTMGLPIVLLFVFLGKSASLPGSEDGIHAYIGVWDTSVLTERPDVWSTAVSQIFFSIGVTFGIMTAFGSHCKHDEPAFVNSVVIALANSCYSFLSGFAVFSALGHLAYLDNTTIDELDVGGFSLVFGTWPVVLGKLPGGIHFVRLLFFNLILLGIDSAFALVEALQTVLADTPQLRNTPKWIITGAICFVGFLLSLIYANDAGLFFLDVIDYYINFIMILVGFFETFGAGWMYGVDDQIKTLGILPVACYMAANFGSVIVACAVWYGLGNEDAVWAGFVTLFVLYFFGLLVTTILLKKVMDEDPEKWPTWGSIYWELSFSNVFNLRNKIQRAVGAIPGIWCILIKQFLPHILIILFVNLAQSKNEEGKAIFGNYGGYAAQPFQVLGILSVVFAMFLFVIGIFVPSIYAPFNIVDDDEIEGKIEGKIEGDKAQVEENEGKIEGKEVEEAGEESPVGSEIQT